MTFRESNQTTEPKKSEDSLKAVEAHRSLEENRMRKPIAVATTIIVSACATPSSGIVDVGNGYFTVAHQGDGVWVSTANLKNRALTEAKQYCTSSQKELQVINVREIPAGPFRFPETEATFTCR